MKTMKSDNVNLSCSLTSFSILEITVTFWLFLFAVLCCCANNVNAEETTALTFPIDCRPYHMRSMKFLLKNFNKCSRELKANSTSDKEYEEKMGCALKCTMRNTGYSENDLITVDTVTRAVEKLLPKGLSEAVVQMLVTRCHEKYGEKLDPEDPQCRSYSEYAFCIQNCIADLVDSELCIKFEKKGH